MARNRRYMINNIVQQFGLAKLARISRRGFFAPLMGLIVAALTFGTPAQDSGTFRQSGGTKLQPGDIVYVDSGDAIRGGFVIKVDGRTHGKSVLSSGGL